MFYQFKYVLVKICCITGCWSTYDKGKTVRFYRLPSEKEERKCWIKAIRNNNILDGPDTVAYERHFPRNCTKINVNGKDRSNEPPSIFENIPLSIVPTPLSKQRVTKRTSLSVRDQKEDELAQYIEHDRVAFEELCKDIHTRQFVFPLTSFVINENLISNLIIFYSL